MALSTKFPQRHNYSTTEEWADALTTVLSKNLGSIEEPAVGHVVLYGGTNPPTGYLKADGSTISAKIYPALVNRLGSATLPNIPDVSGFHYAVRAR